MAEQAQLSRQYEALLEKHNEHRVGKAQDIAMHDGHDVAGKQPARMRFGEGVRRISWTALR